MTWYLDTYTKDANAFCGHHFQMEDLFPEVAEEETLNCELDPLRDYIPVDQLDGKVHFDNHDDFLEEPYYEPYYEKVDGEYIKAYSAMIEELAPKADFNLSLANSEVTETREINDTPCESSICIESMSPQRQFGYHYSSTTGRFSSKEAQKDDARINRPVKDKYNYDEETDEFTHWETRYTPNRGRNHRVRGQINPPRMRKERHQKLSMLFAYERHMEEMDHERDLFEQEIARREFME